jgi:Predicted metal-dependent hydrolase of the TIM-barrel fold
MVLAACSASGQGAPVADHHQHLFSPAMVALLDTTHAMQPITARDVIALLDSAGIRQAALLSVAYIYGSPKRSVPDEYAKVRAENDWNAAQAAEYPDRLRAFCSFNPLKEYALDEIARCARDPRLARGDQAPLRQLRRAPGESGACGAAPPSLPGRERA